MEISIPIDGRDVRFKATGATLLKYKAQFHRDIIKDVMEMVDLMKYKQGDDNLNCINIEKLNMDVFYNLLWIMAKTADPKIGPQEEWLDTFSMFPVFDILNPAIELFMASLQITTKKK